jgi:hypothetical protein
LDHFLKVAMFSGGTPRSTAVDREALDQVHLAVADESVDQFTGQPADVGLQQLDAARVEGSAHQEPLALVQRRVGEQQDGRRREAQAPLRLGAQLLGCLGVVEQFLGEACDRARTACLGAREGLRVAKYLHDVVVPCDDISLEPLVVRDGLLPAEHVVQGEGALHELRFQLQQPGEIGRAIGARVDDVGHGCTPRGVKKV